MDLSGKVAIITGSSSGIGEAVARSLSDNGVRVVINSSKSAEMGLAVAESLPNAIYIQGSIADEGFSDHLIASTIEKYGRLDIVVNNAGTTKVIPHSDTEAATVDIWREIFEVNVFGTWSIIRSARHELEKSDCGQIINITSVAGLRPTGSSIPYACSKAALNHMTSLLAATLGPKIRVNAIAPGLVDTPWTADWDAVRSAYHKSAPMARSATPKDIATCAMSLIANEYLTGSIICLDGGFSLKR